MHAYKLYALAKIAGADDGRDQIWILADDNGYVHYGRVE